MWFSSTKLYAIEKFKSYAIAKIHFVYDKFCQIYMKLIEKESDIPLQLLLGFLQIFVLEEHADVSYNHCCKKFPCALSRV